MNLTSNIGNLLLKNPVLTASGTFGYGEEFADFIDLNRLGGFIVKGTTGEAREGNPYPRMAETPMGMLNAVGLQNKGVDYFIENILPRISKLLAEPKKEEKQQEGQCGIFPTDAKGDAALATRIIVNVSGSTAEEYVEVAKKLNSKQADGVAAIEVNISCPNVKQGGMAFGTDPKMAGEIVRKIRKVYDKTMIVKLSPNVTHIAEMALAVEEAGADAVSLINTLLGMAVDVERQRPVLSTITGGLSGPCVKPIALRMVWQVAKAVHIPVIGVGGIGSTEDALEFLMAGASAVQIGSANFVDPAITVKIVNGLEAYLKRKKINNIQDIIGII
ncbi:MAG: dihydroorotate dehydrogenase [Bacteroidales bacterium]